MTIQAIVLDFGGVIWLPGSVPLSDKWAARCGLDAATFDQIVFNSEWSEDAFIGTLTDAQYWANIGRKLHLPAGEEVELEEDCWAGIWNTPLLDYMRQLKPTYKLGVLSDATVGTRERIAPRVNNSLFDVIVISAEEKIRKPNPEIYHRLLDRLGVKAEETVFIDDRSVNIVGAQQVGMQAIKYKDFAQMQQELKAILHR